MAFSDIWSIDNFVTKDIITTIYTVGTVILALSAIIVFLVGLTIPKDSWVGILLAVVLLLAIIPWRIMCEACIIFFSIDDTLDEINDVIKTLVTRKSE